MASSIETLFQFNLKIFNIVGKLKLIKLFLKGYPQKTALKKNVELGNNYKDKCYICALGPSLRSVNIEKLQNEDVFVVNRFAKFGEKYPSFVPKYYVMTDTGFDSDNNIEDFKYCLKSYIDKGTKFILTSKLIGSKALKAFDSSNIYFVTCIDGNLKPHKKYKLDGIWPAFMNVIGATIFAAMLMGYKKIVLLGCDFSSFASPKRNHCYNESTTKRLEPMHEDLFGFSFAAYNHEELQRMADYKGVSILNSTKGSLIDAYKFEIEESLYF